MNRACVSVFMASLFLMAHSAFAQSSPASNRNLIVTEGTAEVMGQNDSARLTIAVVTDGRDLEQVSAKNAAETKGVLRAIKALSIGGLKLKTANYRVIPQRDYKARPPRFKGYEVHNSIEATLEGFEPEPLSKHVSRLVGEALESGANSIHDMQFYIKNKEPLEKEALTQATREAMDRARTLAEAAGVKLKRIASLSTQPMYTPPTPQMFRAAEMKAEAGAPPMEIGESHIRIQVSVAYEIE
ncbi:MAG: SIMPL domain-containing protein [Thermodesulfobacteriota bacterium]|nr:SIMPL domain-containing protein [Thermodesulfobacteriota bacterium]